MPEQQCAIVQKGDAFGDCVDEASASLAPGATGSAFCDATCTATPTSLSFLDPAKMRAFVSTKE